MAMALVPLTLPQIEMTRASGDDLATLTEVLEGAASWLASRGIHQWRPGLFREAQEYLSDTIRRGEVHFAIMDGQVAGTLSLQWADRFIWGEQPADAGYVHRLAAQRCFAGRGVGLAMLRWAEQQATARGRQYLRLDCWGANQPLCAYYRNAGFTAIERKIIHAHGREWDTQLFQKQVL